MYAGLSSTDPEERGPKSTGAEAVPGLRLARFTSAATAAVDGVLGRFVGRESLVVGGLAAQAAYGNGLPPLEFAAADCEVRSNTKIECVTAPGSGKGHNWEVSLGGQTSNLLPKLGKHSSQAVQWPRRGGPESVVKYTDPCMPLPHSAL